VRRLQAGSANFLICVGQEHKTGQHDAGAAMAALEGAARRRLGVEAIAYRWSAQNFRSPDLLPYIGKDVSGAYIATGFATDGLVYGTLAASIVSDDLLGRANRWADLYRASRVAPVKAAKGTAAETASVLKVVVQDYLTRRQHDAIETLQRGVGSIVEVDGERVAAYRDDAGHVFVVSPVCTHLKCMVHLECARDELGLPVPRQPLRTGRARHRGPRDRAVEDEDAARRVRPGTAAVLPARSGS